MTTTVRATFDGEVFRPEEPVELPANTAVELTVNAPPSASSDTEPYAWLDLLQTARLSGPSDASENLDAYLYHLEPWAPKPGLP
jgi:hypothetical protein